MAARKVLVVDDDPVVLEMVRDALEELDYEVYTHSSAFGTSAELMKYQPDLLILDIDMPGLKGDRICKNLKILFYSVTEEEDLARMAKKQGADAYLTKTGDIRDLQRKVRSLV